MYGLFPVIPNSPVCLVASAPSSQALLEKRRANLQRLIVRPGASSIPRFEGGPSIQILRKSWLDRVSWYW